MALDLRRPLSGGCLTDMMCQNPLDDIPVKGWAELPADIIGAIWKRLGDRQSTASLCRVNVHWRDSVRLHVKKVSLTSFMDIDNIATCLPSMTTMVVEGDRFSELDMLRLASLQRLRSLTLTNCRAKRGHPANTIAVLSMLTRLQDLVLDDVAGPAPHILDGILEKMKGLTSVAFTSMSPHVSLPPLNNLQNVPGLRALSVVNGVVDDHLRLSGLSHLPLLTHLHTLHLQGVGLNDAILMGMACFLTGLTRLHLCDEEDVTDNGLASIAKFSSLRVLELELSASQRRHLQPGGITNQGLAAMSALDGLLELNLSGNPRINSLGLGFLPHLRGLRRLNLAWLPSPAEGSLNVVARLIHLETLCLAYTLATDEQLHVVGVLTKLRNLDIGFTRAGPRTAMGICRLEHLRMLNLRSCTQLHAVHLELIAQKCRRLEFINIDGCRICGTVVLNIFLATDKQCLRFSHQPLQDESWDRPLWEEKWLMIFRFINIMSTFMFTSPSLYNVGSNKWRICYATSTKLVLYDLCGMVCALAVTGLFFCWLLFVHIIPFLCRWRTLARKCWHEGPISVVFEGLSSAALFYSDVRRALCLMDH